ncbi:hypothetical protein [Butyrivibrio sp. NC3005]|uniref:hypothetical protein n=1 Tax=Butyrivibrio sp. NC3005 TaxID=1280685 RepID=UPI00041FCC69|nr:hypothetical protein [Butyrivibrio sp. NC3005]
MDNIKKKSFIITIDTEGDYIWNRNTWTENSVKNRITIRNSSYIERFQRLCEKYGYKPTYLVDYEMCAPSPFVDLANECIKKKNAEIGMHMHAWTIPPFYNLKRGKETGGNHPYIGEYPTSVIEDKVKVITHKIQDSFGVIPKSHRSGRWYIDRKYLAILKKHGYIADCSVIPGKDWTFNAGLTEGSHGIDYRRFPNKAYKISMFNIGKEGKSGLIEVPLTTAYKNKQLIELRPYRHNIKDLNYLVDKCTEEKRDYLEFMLHSSELMRAGSPNFLTENDIEVLYDDLEQLFEKISYHYEGVTLSQYVENMRKIL